LLLQAFDSLDGFGAAEGPTDWMFVSFNVSSSSDLQAVRAQLGGSVEYFERDLTAHIMLPRSLMAASSNTSSATNASDASSQQQHQASAPGPAAPEGAGTAASNDSSGDDGAATIQPVQSEQSDKRSANWVNDACDLCCLIKMLVHA
jgi:hypothetical protein